VLISAGKKRLMYFMTQRNVPVTTTLEILLMKRNFRSVMKSFMAMKGDGVKC
jgi:hypothetical protein